MAQTNIVNRLSASTAACDSCSAKIRSSRGTISPISIIRLWYIIVTEQKSITKMMRKISDIAWSINEVRSVGYRCSS